MPGSTSQVPLWCVGDLLGCTSSENIRQSLPMCSRYRFWRCQMAIFTAAPSFGSPTSGCMQHFLHALECFLSKFMPHAMRKFCLAGSRDPSCRPCTTSAHAFMQTIYVVSMQHVDDKLTCLLLLHVREMQFCVYSVYKHCSGAGQHKCWSEEASRRRCVLQFWAARSHFLCVLNEIFLLVCSFRLVLSNPGVGSGPAACAASEMG